MDRRAILRRSALAAAAATLAAPASAKPMPAVRWRLTSSYPTSLDAIYGAGQVFAQYRRGTDRGPLPDPRLRPGRGGAPPAGAGRGPGRHGGGGAYHPSFYIGKNPAFAFATGVPFGMNTRQQNAWMYGAAGSTC